MPAPKRRWLPAFSIRTLLIVTTLLCGYAACWWPTKKTGVLDVDLLVRPSSRAERTATAVAPLIISARCVRESKTLPPPANFTAFRGYYFWFFGYVAKLPYEREFPPTSLLESFEEDDGRFLEAVESQQQLRDAMIVEEP